MAIEVCPLGQDKGIPVWAAIGCRKKAGYSNHREVIDATPAEAGLNF
jgi:hypothetical protein